MEYVQVINVEADLYPPDWDAVRRAARANPGSLWLVGNEPECVHQGNRTPEEYAMIYHESYTTLKEADPQCQVAVGGVVQPTPLRLEWLDRFMDRYLAVFGERVPVDVWNIHNQVLLERRGWYGCEIPAGLAVDEGVAYGWWENADAERFKEHIWAFRRWMEDRDEGEKPLVISEYGVLYPSHWFDGLGGAPGDEIVQQFMGETFTFMLTARDAKLGDPNDDDRLVQRWLWFSLNHPRWGQTEEAGFNGGLVDPFTHQLTPFGSQYESLLRGFVDQ